MAAGGSEIEIYGVDKAIEQFKFYETPSHAVFQGKEMLYRHVGDDQDEANNVFAQNIRAIDPEASGRYSVRFYEDVEKITNGTEYVGTFRFKVRTKQDLYPAMPGGNGQTRGLSYGDMEWIRFLQEERSRLLEENQDLTAALAEYEEDDAKVKKKLGALGFIGEAGQSYPWMQEYMGSLLDIVKNITGKMSSGGGTTYRSNEKPSALTAEDAKNMFQSACAKLMAYYHKLYGEGEGDKKFSEDLTRLANMTDDPEGFEYVINKLRNA